MKDSDIIAPQNAEYFIALGTAFTGLNDIPLKVDDMIYRLSNMDMTTMATDTVILPALFEKH
ncbi:BadF/BadG/BcrA/BcrD family ATPase, partial [Listeria monocytogenes FSL F2-208]